MPAPLRPTMPSRSPDESESVMSRNACTTTRPVAPAALPRGGPNRPEATDSMVFFSDRAPP